VGEILRSPVSHLVVPAFGRRWLGAIRNEDVQRLKAQLQCKSPKTVNKLLTVLSVLLKKAVEWEVIDRLPCTVKLLRVDKGNGAFHDVEEYERLVVVAGAIDRRTLLIVLLGGDAGLRCGEMLALEWADIDLTKRQLCVRQSDWNGQVEPRRMDGSGMCRSRDGWPRHCEAGGCSVRTTVRHSHGRSCRTGCGSPPNGQTSGRGSTSCVIRSARTWQCVARPAKAIQELAGHADLTMTQRYMHLSPAALDAAIRLLDRPGDQVLELCWKRRSRRKNDQYIRGCNWR
jgi:integrase